MEFEWDESKNAINISKHGLSFYDAQKAFLDQYRLIFSDVKHSSAEKRYFCVGRMATGDVVTIRFTIRDGHIRIIGAGHWREGRKKYEQQN